MRKHPTNQFLAFAMIAGLGLLLAGHAAAQTFITLHSFTAGSDGANPYAGLFVADGILYGTTLNGEFNEQEGYEGSGGVFAVKMDGSGFRAVLSTADSYGAVILSSNMLYGTAENGGSSGTGNVFAVNTSGLGFTNLHSFAAGVINYPNSDGMFPFASLILSGSTLYGTTVEGGSSKDGTVFAVNTDGSSFTNLHEFSGGDGDSPYCDLALSGNTLYGTTAVGGSNSNGAIFAIQTDGTGFTNLYNFKGTDGAFPSSGLILSGTILYGTTYMGGSNNNGTVFSITTDGTGFTNLHIFTAGKSLYMNISSNTDGAAPKAGLILSGNTLYGTTTSGGPAGAGTVFAINTSGTAFTNLHSFTASSSGLFSGTNGDGTYPYGRLALSANTLYGTAKNGGSSGFGTVFSLTLPAPQLAITPTSSNIILTWPTNENGFDFTGYTLQCASDLVSGCWTNVSPAPSVVNGQLTVTNPISSTQMFYRLTQ